jgi:hypothetical protein
MGTIADIEASLPNGFHDAEILGLDIDYEKMEARLSLHVWVGDLDSTEVETYRDAKLAVCGLQFLSIEPPCQGYPFDRPGPIVVDARSMTNDRPSSLPPAAGDEFLHEFYVNNWNAFIRIAARSASWQWSGEPYVRGS